ncbi:hypothetical protein KUCAC02_020694 [Chaenocephalus aceratus]|uniref:Uncharacterized protein n=1 Tax=Chaenocephalus aceratus TaxID=36190 RepID=A0ACB9XD80_CHAAC|nr:hypothetical protein KUCAC02_020694 [Chaenocephalus aceratus]
MANAYSAIPLPHLGQSDHLSLFFYPTYTQLIKPVKPTVRTVKQFILKHVMARQQIQTDLKPTVRKYKFLIFVDFLRPIEFDYNFSLKL